MKSAHSNSVQLPRHPARVVVRRIRILRLERRRALFPSSRPSRVFLSLTEADSPVFTATKKRYQTACIPSIPAPHQVQTILSHSESLERESANRHPSPSRTRPMPWTKDASILHVEGRFSRLHPLSVNVSSRCGTYEQHIHRVLCVLLGPGRPCRVVPEVHESAEGYRRILRVPRENRTV